MAGDDINAVHCSKCGQELTARASFCPKCGNAVSGVGPIPKAIGAGLSREVLSALVLVVGLALTIGIVFFIRNQRDHPGGRNPKTPDAAERGPKVVPILRLHGSNTIGAHLAVELAKGFLAKRGVTNIREVKLAGKDEMLVQGDGSGPDGPQAIEIFAKGSATGFKDLASGRCDIAMSSRKVELTELAATTALGDLTSDASENVIALDGVAVIVNRANPVRTLTVDQIRQLFSGECADWKDCGLGYGGAVHIYARNEDSGTWETFKSLVMGSTAKLAAKAVRLEDSTELSQKVSGDAGGIGFIGLPFILDARAVAVAETEGGGMDGKNAEKRTTTPLMPNQGTVATEDYPLSRRLYLYTAAVPSNPLVGSFVSFAKSDEGQDLVAKAGFVSQKLCKSCQPEITVDANAPSDYRQFTSRAVRQPLDFRFRFGSSKLDPKALDDVERMARYLRELHYESGHLVLLGFADSRGSREANLAISKERAQAVRGELEKEGVKAVQVAGLGEEMPVKSNDTEGGREKNRRVEVWVR